VDTATVSVIASAVVGVGGVVAAATVPIVLDRRAAERRRVEAKDGRIDELRSVVDEAAVALIRVVDAMPQVEEVREGREAVRAVLGRLRSELLRVWQQEARLAARLGRGDDLVERYRDAHEELGRMLSYWSGFVDGEETGDFTVETAGQGPAMAAFFAVAADRIGPDRDDG
jgi:hypothetical protein